ncbi:Uncharacterized membrane protein YgdD, TMEM256/DUF423 family [Saccharicrinis carchari]|uniref:Uncharacterized membrane protein YgdD, TMEM256/DUF423 family n=1 Tax=Saccharicrinis carchari TaxID=1168039 RepID=A0A521EPF6_SACCC|nr:DUF423 domain-containing protein [Saccharicrinis carchari]SMO85798.1 Uncharacterized membrane protein YgdD, TMEM256/DUF423 family [Saccharicrinis carchari]
MKKIVLLVGACYGLLSVVLGAFGAHALKKILSAQALQSFETGVKYQMYHALVLLLIGFYFSFSSKIESYMAWAFILGTFLFSVSIYFLALGTTRDWTLGWLGPITPLGGLFLIIAWVLLIVNIYNGMK